ncbi:MAG: MgtC/SapB family protein [Clostridia bacterium]|nr:MgtC/SapB family protein [Clostridia bacterium]
MLSHLVTPNQFSGLEALIRIFVAVITGSIVGIEREYKNRLAGLRTHVLVSLGACMIALIECVFLYNLDNLATDHVTYNFGRISAQVVSGIGVLGAGTIFMSERKIGGLTTAASVWNTACLGMATGYGYYWISIIGCLLVLAVLLSLQKIIRVNSLKRVEVKFIHRQETLQFINEFFEKNGIKVLNLDFHIESTPDKGVANHSVYTNIYTLQLPSSLNYPDLINYLASYKNIQVVRATNT